MSLAPIILFVYNRPWHTEQTLEALMTNELANESILYIYADGPKADANESTIEEIKRTREIIKKKKWCKEVLIIEREENLGLANSIISGVTEIVNKFGEIIVLEDDIVCGKGYLKYMNDGLRRYENENLVCSIHAYNYPINTNGLPETFFLKGADCWGWATWKRGWDMFESDGQKLHEQILAENLIKEFNFNDAYDYFEMLKSQVDGKINSWAIRWYASAFLNNTFTLYPKISLIKNIGLDGSGTHCENDLQLSNYFQDYCEVKVIEIVDNKKVKERIKNYFKPNHISNFIRKIKNEF